MKKVISMDTKHYTAIVAFSTPSGPLHVGHALGQTIAHVTALYEAQKLSREVFFPLGIHATGKDLLKIINDLEQGVNPKKYNLNESAIKKIVKQETVEKKVDFLLNEYYTLYRDDLSQLGIELNTDAFFSTHQKTYHTFTQWTIRKLQEHNLIVKTSNPRPYCSDCKEIKAIEKDESEARAKGVADWSNIRVSDEGIEGGEFYCRLHPNTQLTVHSSIENAINYGDVQAQEKAIAYIRRNLKTFPHSYKRDLEDIIHSRKEKPMERDASKNIGTPSPLNPSMVIEALSDSNIYMEFYAIAWALHKGLLQETHLTDTLYDHLLLNKGTTLDVAKQLGVLPKTFEHTIQEIRSRMTIDLNVAGYEHKEVHFPFSLFTHANLLPEYLFPQEFIMTSHVMRNGEKMSKSRGNIKLLSDAITLTKNFDMGEISTDARPDAIRFYLLNNQPLDKDFDWNDDNFTTTMKRIKKYARFVNNQVDSSGVTPQLTDNYSLWLSTKHARIVEETTRRMDKREYRAASVEMFDKLFGHLTKYVAMCEEHGVSVNNSLINRTVHSQLIMLRPFMPRIVNELYGQNFSEDKVCVPEKNLDAHDKVDYEISPQQFVQDRVKTIIAQIGIMRGKKLLDPEKTLEIVVASDFAKTILEQVPNSRFKPLQGLTYRITVDAKADMVYVSQS